MELQKLPALPRVHDTCPIVLLCNKLPSLLRQGKVRAPLATALFGRHRSSIVPFGMIPALLSMATRTANQRSALTATTILSFSRRLVAARPALGDNCSCPPYAIFHPLVTRIACTRQCY